MLAGDGATPPKILQQSHPAYPRDAFNSKITGTVMVEILIGEDGEVAHAAVRQSIPKLDDAALACVRHWRFEPSRVGGKPIATVAHAPVNFRIY